MGPLVFYTREGHGQAGAEARSFALCEALRAKENSTSRHSGETTLRHSGEGQNPEFPIFVLSLRMFYADVSESKLSWWHKIKLNAQAFWRLFILRPKVLVLQRVHFHLPAALLYLVLFRPKLILDVDDWEFREKSQEKYFLGLGQHCLRLLSRWAHTTVVSSAFLQEHLKPYARRIEKIPTGVDTKIFGKDCFLSSRGEARNLLRCVWVGAFDLRTETLEEILNVIQAFSRQEQSHVELWLVARGEKIPVFEKHAQIRLFSHCSRAEVAEILSQCDVGLLPLFSDTRFNHAKSPVKLFEYFASGLIPVCANRGEASAIIRHGDNGFLVNSPIEMIQTLNYLATLPPEEKSKLQENAKKLASLYSLDKAVQSWEILLSNRR
jgi:glycosyltransferase involved in cell wall biosynthesis